MSIFDSDGVEIAYDAMGRGNPVMLIHGFAANRLQAWQSSDWYDTLIQSGREIVALDHRGHGQSQKLYDPADYAIENMMGDVLRLMDHLDIEKAPMISHSMGARITAEIILRHPDRVTAAVLIGVGKNLIVPQRDPQLMADAMLADNPMTIEDAGALSFRAFADSTRSDRKALAACTSAMRNPLDPDELAQVKVPVFVLGAERDEFSGRASTLADAIPGALHETMPRAAHHTVLVEPMSKDVVFQFLGFPAPAHHEHQW